MGLVFLSVDHGRPPTIRESDMERRARDPGAVSPRRRLRAVAFCAAALVAAGGCGPADLGGTPQRDAGAGAAALTISGIRPLTAEDPPFPLVETYLDVDPTDEAALLATAMSVTADATLLYGSWDHGTTWSRIAGPESGAFPGGDPMLTFDATGRAYVSTITPEIQVWRSADQGQSWAGPVVVGEGLASDRQWVAAGAGDGRGGHATVHVAAKTAGDDGRDVILVSRSRDGGATFSSPVLMPLDSGYLNAVTDLVVRSDGTILLPYLANYRRAPGPEEVFQGSRWLLTSEDDGRGWSGPYRVSGNLQFGNRSWDRAMKGLGGGGLAVEEGDGPEQGSVYMTWAGVLGEHLQILVARSRDGGRTWSEPVRVNDGGFDADHSTPTIAVDAGGIVAVTWNDRRHDSDGTCFRHYVAVSEDGGRTFSPNRAVSPRPTCLEPGSRWLNGGDTQGLSPHGDGFRTVWSVGRESDGSLRPWTAFIRAR